MTNGEYCIRGPLRFLGAGHDTRALQAYLGHRNIQHTVRNTELAPNRFKDFWR
jgi:site-specific recombinase XerD